MFENSYLCYICDHEWENDGTLNKLEECSKCHCLDVAPYNSSANEAGNPATTT